MLALAAGTLLVRCSSSPSDTGPGTEPGSDSGSGGSHDGGSGRTGTDGGGGRSEASAGGDTGSTVGSDTGTNGSQEGGEGGSTTGSTVTRPSYNTGDGFFVLNGKLYDPNGHEFVVRGSDRCHYDSDSQPAMSGAKPNTVRTFVGTNFGQTWAGLANIIQTQNIAYSEVPVITAASTTAGTATSCSSDTTVLSDVVANSWVATASTWTAFNKNGIFNIANEWGPSGSSVWQTSYATAIGQMRTAGYLGPLMIDAGGCGQDETDLAQYAEAVFKSDPQRNIIFSYHMYGGTNDDTASVTGIKKGNPTVVSISGSGACHPFAPTYCPSMGMTNTYSGITAYFISGVSGATEANGQQPAPANVGGTSGAWTVTLSVDSSTWGAFVSGGTIVDYNGNYALRSARLAALAKTTGAAFVIGEFGPGRNIGPSPTLLTPQEVLSAAEENGLGWMAWAWDDNDLSGGDSDNDWFALAYHAGAYGSSSDLTIFGQEIVEGCLNPAPGGCGCPDSPAPAMSVVAPGCKGTPAPKYSALSLKALAKPASIF